MRVHECVRGCVAGSGTRSRHLAGLVDLPGCYPECARAQWPHGQARIVQDKRWECSRRGKGRFGDSPHSGKCRGTGFPRPRSCLSPKSERQHARAQRGEEISFGRGGCVKCRGDENTRTGCACARAAALTGRGASCSPTYPPSKPPAAGAMIWTRRRVPRSRAARGYLGCENMHLRIRFTATSLLGFAGGSK